MPLHGDFDFHNPDYAKAFRQRIAFIERMRAEPETIPQLKAYYSEHPADFINDFGITFDPR